jgi:hypothetical protein
MQAIGSLTSVGLFSPYGAKKDLQKKKSTMLPQAKAAFAKSYDCKLQNCRNPQLAISWRIHENYRLPRHADRV